MGHALTLSGRRSSPSTGRTAVAARSVLVATLLALGACASSEVILENSFGARVHCPGPPGPQQQCVDNAERLGYHRVGIW
jgi:hypothetical protein